MPVNSTASQRHGKLRIVLVGKAGVGRTSSANTILGRREFQVYKTTLPPKTLDFKKAKAEVDGRDVYVIDTPGLYNTYDSEDEIKRKIAKCLCLASPGPHVFLVTIQVGSFSKEELKTVELIQTVFGKDAWKYTMALFTHGDKLKGKRIEDFISQSDDLKQFTKQCLGGIHVFNNQELDNCSQVRQLLQKIDKMVAANGGNYYTNDMFQQAEQEIEKQKKVILAQKLWRQGPGESRYVSQALDKTSDEKARSEAENFDGTANIVAGAGAGIATGGALGGLLGIIGGPVGIAVGAILGAQVGGGVGAGTGSGLASRGTKCTIM